jgi:flagella basal body P-ring formation protein FlgA
MKCLEHLALLSLNLAVSLLLLTQAAIGADIELKESAKVKGPYIQLTDISKIKGNGAISIFLKSLRIKRSPPLCRTTEISKEEVAGAIYRYLRENQMVEKYKLRLTGAQKCKVIRPCLKIDSFQIKQKIKDFLESKYKNIKVVSLYAPSLTVPSENFKDNIQIKDKGKRFIRIKYTIYLNNQIYKTFWITARVEPLVKAVVAARNIPKGKIITTEDLTFEKLPERTAKKGFLNFKEVVGKVTKRNISKGTLIKQTFLKPNFLTLRGKPVKITYSKGNINIELLGIALENGALGDIIKVENISTRKVLLCEVIGKNSVKFLEGR